MTDVTQATKYLLFLATLEKRTKEVFLERSSFFSTHAFFAKQKTVRNQFSV